MAKRVGAILQATATVAYHLLARSQTKFAASVEVTDRCNAGCNYCYVYEPEWDQRQRMQGYLQLPADEHRQKEQEVFRTLERLKQEGIVHVTLVGGDPTLAPKTILRAAELFPVVWVVTNGAGKLPPLPQSVVVFVSIDGPPDYHNQSRDPLGFFSNNHYGNLNGMSAAIVRNINESQRGAYAHITLTKPTLDKFLETVDWLVKDIDKLRGIAVSGTASKSKSDPFTFTSQDRQKLKSLIAKAAQKYGWKLFPLNQPLANDYLFDKEHIIHSPEDCSVSKRVKSLDFEGNSVGKCVLRDETLCETCVCNITGIAQAIDHFDLKTISGVVQATFG